MKIFNLNLWQKVGIKKFENQKSFEEMAKLCIVKR